jgi:hypothetical protein
MTRSLSAYLRERVIAASKMCSFDTGGNAALPDQDVDDREWVSLLSRYQRDKCAQAWPPSRTKLDAHEAVILCFIEDTWAITLPRLGVPCCRA